MAVTQDDEWLRRRMASRSATLASRRPIVPEGSKHCTKCGVIQPRDSFQADRARADGKQPHCKACTRANNDRWYARNSVAYKATCAAWYAANKSVKSATAKAWKAANRAMCRAMSTRRAERVRVASTLTKEDVRAAVEMSGGQCAYCLRPSAVLEVEHVLAIATGGSNTADNIVMACKPCNLRKHTSGPLAMLNRNGAKSWL